MDKYKVMLYPKAFCDIDDIYAYIAIYKIDKGTKQVFVVTVQYQGRDL